MYDAVFICDKILSVVGEYPNNYGCLAPNPVSASAGMFGKIISNSVWRVETLSFDKTQDDPELVERVKKLKILGPSH